MTIFKYDLNPTGVTSLRVPGVFVPLSVGFQNGGLKLWAYVSEDQKVFQDAKFFSAMTGLSFPDHVMADSCIGRATAENDSFVVHVFKI
jgi:hypothetical protein